MTTLTLNYRVINNKVKSIHLPKVNWKVLYALGVLFLLSMLIFYIFFINELTKGAYMIKNYNKEMNKLSDENKVLQASFAESGFLGDVEDKLRNLSFEKTTQVKYVQILESSLGMAK